jgi:hypothetical protein
MLDRMGYVVAHARKVKTPAGLRNVAAHNSRTNVYAPNGALLEPTPPWLTHPERAHHNTGDFLSPDVAMKRWRDRIASANLKRKPQKNAAAGIEFVISATPGSLSKAGDWKRYFDDAAAWLARRYGAANVVQAVTHYDEKTPHMHVVMVPIIQDRGEGARYSSAEFLGGREGLRNLQSDFAAEIGKKHGMERGVEGSKARHTDQAEFAAMLKDKHEELKGLFCALQEDKAAWEAAVKVHQEKPGAQLARFVGGLLYGVQEADYPACWKAFGDKAEEFRQSRGRESSRENLDQKKGRGR